MVRWVIGSILHGVDPLSYFSFQPVLHNWCNKGCGMCYPVYGVVHIKEPLLLIGKSSLCGSSRFPLSLSEWSLTICLMPYNRKQNVLSVSLKHFLPSFTATNCPPCKFKKQQKPTKNPRFCAANMVQDYSDNGTKPTTTTFLATFSN